MQILIQLGDLGNIVGLPDTLRIFPVDCDQRQRLDIHNSQVTLHNRWFLPWQDALAAWSSLFKGTELKIQISECKACKRCKRYHKRVKTLFELLSSRPKKGVLLSNCIFNNRRLFQTISSNIKFLMWQLWYTSFFVVPYIHPQNYTRLFNCPTRQSLLLFIGSLHWLSRFPYPDNEEI